MLMTEDPKGTYKIPRESISLSSTPVPPAPGPSPVVPTVRFLTYDFRASGYIYKHRCLFFLHTNGSVIITVFCTLLFFHLICVGELALSVYVKMSLIFKGYIIFHHLDMQQFVQPDPCFWAFRLCSIFCHYPRYGMDLVFPTYRCICRINTWK